MRACPTVLAALCACASTVPEARYRNELSTQRADYEERLRRIEDERRREKEDRDAVAAELVRVQEDLRARIEMLERALADKQRLLADDGEAAKPPATDLQSALTRAFTGQVTLRSNGAVSIPADLLFAKGSTRLASDAAPLVRAIAEVLASDPAQRIAIEAHTDSVRPADGAPAADTWALAQAQGLALGRALVGAGLDPTRLSIAAFGEYQPIATNDTEEGRAKNRRVELRAEPLVRPR